MPQAACSSDAALYETLGAQLSVEEQQECQALDLHVADFGSGLYTLSCGGSRIGFMIIMVKLCSK